MTIKKLKVKARFFFLYIKFYMLINYHKLIMMKIVVDLKAVQGYYIHRGRLFYIYNEILQIYNYLLVIYIVGAVIFV